MRINRPELLKALQQVQPGLSMKDVLEQSSCFVFTKSAENGAMLATFNDELCCKIPFDIGIEGAIASKTFLEILSKLPEDEIDIFLDPEKPGELRIKGKNKKVGITREAEIHLPVDKVEIPKKWVPIPGDFVEGLEVVCQCASGNPKDSFTLTCVHITTEYVEACDNFQMARFSVKLPVRGDVLVRASTIKPICVLGVSEFAETRNWLHFRTESGLIASVRKHDDDYRNLDRVLELDGGHPATLPAGLAEAIDKADIFSRDTESNQLMVDLQPGILIVTGMGPNGWYSERKKIVYDGVSFKFMIAPKLLLEITKRHHDCIISPERLRVDGAKFTFVSSLGEASN